MHVFVALGMHLLQSRSISAPWLLAVVGSWALLILAVAPPWLDGEAGSAVMAGFGQFCHQIPERSFRVNGVPFAVCHRDFGILAGLAIGLSVVAPMLPSAVRRMLGEGSRAGQLLLLSAFPTALDWFVGAAGIWANTSGSRFSTGALFGLTAGIVLASALLVPRGGMETPPATTFPSLTYPST